MHQYRLQGGGRGGEEEEEKEDELSVYLWPLPKSRILIFGRVDFHRFFYLLRRPFLQPSPPQTLSVQHSLGLGGGEGGGGGVAFRGV